MSKGTVLITGASSGIGKATAEQFARAGHRVFATARRPEAVAQLRASGLDALTVDVTSDDSVAAAVQAVRQQAGRVDVLVNNAGYGQYGVLEDVSDAEARRQFDANVFGLMRVTRAVLPLMRQQGSGRIVNISSVAGRMATPAAGWYSASKHAVEALSDALRLEVAPFGIQVSVIQPGAIQTGFDSIAVRELAQTTRTEAYRPTVAAFAALVTGSYRRAPGPAVVARAILRAATARRAPVRVALPAEAQLIILLKGLVGDRLFDRLVMSQLRSSAPQAANSESRAARSKR